MTAEARIRSLIVDDEAPARSRIHQLLKGEHDFELVGEYTTGRQAIEGIQRDNPDLVFSTCRCRGSTASMCAMV